MTENDPRPLVLLLGAARYTLDACVRLGVDAVVVTGAPERDAGAVPVPAQLTAVHADSQSDAESVLAALHRAGLAGLRYDAVVTTDEFALVTAGLLARHLGCRAIDPDTAVRFRDKEVQKRTVRAAGVPTARTTVIEDVHDLTGLTALPYPRAVVKPVAGASTRLTATVTDLAGLRAFGDRLRAGRSTERTFLLEEFVSGEEWIADGFVLDGEVRFLALGAYGSPCLSVVDQDRPLWMRRIDPQREAWRYALAEPLVRRSLTALGLTDGVFHMELFHDPADGRLVFSECAARRGGGLIHEETLAKFGIDLGEAMLLCGLGRLPDREVRTDPRVIGSSFLPGRPGTVVACPSAGELEALPGVEYARVEAAPGTSWSDSLASTDQRAAQVLVAAESEAALLRRFDELRRWFDDRLVTVPNGSAAPVGVPA
ncbi:hypothetical protein ACFYUY_10800 [Kitasatospora sp. NPDC004745]|uniref:hypothetical protein n=1 Tax=unclassified Kitasatospora TaxID=2633591 RepID=UPI003400B23A